MKMQKPFGCEITVRQSLSAWPRRWILPALFAISALSCGEAFSDGDILEFSTLALYRGTLTKPSELDSAHSLRAAVLWKTTADHKDQPFIVGTDIALSSTNVSASELEVRLQYRPPEAARLTRADVPEAMRSYIPSSTWFSMGTIIVYEERDGNEQLDWAEVLGRSCGQDRLLGVNQRLQLWYFALHLPDERFFKAMEYSETPRLGYNLLALESECLPSFSCNKGKFTAPEIAKYKRPHFAGVNISLDSVLVKDSCPAEQTLKSYGQCGALRKDLFALLKETCPTNDKSCLEDFAPQAPLGIYNARFHRVLSSLTSNQCCFSGPGKEPFLCNPGQLGCPFGYQCCDGKCSKACAKDEGAVWVTAPAGSFLMGYDPTDKCPDLVHEDEKQHLVTLTHPFAILSTEVTQQQFRTVMGYNPSKFQTLCNNGKSGVCPANNMTWHEAVQYCNKLSKLQELDTCYECLGEGTDVTCQEKSLYKGTGIYACPGYRLPTEAEWEYAYRAGTQTPLYNGEPAVCDGFDESANEIAWYKGNWNNSAIYPVGLKTPNAWGIYDMAGHVWEWVHDWYLPYDNQVSKFESIDPCPEKSENSKFAWSTGKVTRGGSFSSDLRYITGNSRDYSIPTLRIHDLGFRCIRKVL